MVNTFLGAAQRAPRSKEGVYWQQALYQKLGTIFMRVIAGSARGHKLQSVPGDSTRPITDRAKEALFSILGDWIRETRVLDLFGGTGAVGIEALSRGASFAHFIDRNRKATQTIEANLTHCKLDRQAQVAVGDSFAFLESHRGEAFDLIYIAPPQYQGMWHKALKLVDQRRSLLAPFGAVIVQIHPREDEPVELTFLEEYDRRQYGSVMLIFFAASEDLAATEEEEEEVKEEEEWDEELDETDEMGKIDEVSDEEEEGPQSQDRGRHDGY
jgi:16S rRNA (guanine966-N2)-methyltransferase